MKVYFLSGLGGDKRVFEKLTFHEDHELIYLEYSTPKFKETIQRIAHNYTFYAKWFM